MQCLTEERDRATITWKKDGMTLSGGGGRVTINSQTLQIFNLQREDYGMYQCFVQGKGGSQTEVQASSELRLGGEIYPNTVSTADKVVVDLGLK